MSDEDPILDILEKAARINRFINPPQKALPPMLLAECKRLIADSTARVESTEFPLDIVDTRIAPSVVSISRMRFVILKLIEEGPIDGPTIVGRIKMLNISLVQAGDLIIYVLLHALESDGLLASRRRIESMRVVKTYHLTASGDAVLKKNRGLAISTLLTQPVT